MQIDAQTFTDLRLSKGLTQEQMAEMLGISNSLVSLIEKGLTPVSKKVAFELSKKFEFSLKIPKKRTPGAHTSDIHPTGKPIPYYSVDVTAGNVSLFDDTTDEHPSAYYYLPAFQDCVAVSVKGESMLGKYNPGDIIFIKEAHYWKGTGIVEFGNVYLIFTNTGLRVIKQVRKGDTKEFWKLCSENPEFDDFEIHVDSVIRVFEVKGKLQQNAM